MGLVLYLLSVELLGILEQVDKGIHIGAATKKIKFKNVNLLEMGRKMCSFSGVNFVKKLFCDFAQNII